MANDEIVYGWVDGSRTIIHHPESNTTLAIHSKEEVSRKVENPEHLQKIKEEIKNRDPLTGRIVKVAIEEIQKFL